LLEKKNGKRFAFFQRDNVNLTKEKSW